MDSKILSQDINIAHNMRSRSYAPSTKFTTGCVLVCKNGKRYTGCNIENVGVQSICGERVAFVKAISEGEKEFSYIVIVGGPEGEKAEKECLPCGYCRQFMNEFVDEDFKIYTVDKEKIREYTREDLLPDSFIF